MMNLLSYKVMRVRPNSSRKFKMAAITTIFNKMIVPINANTRTWYHSRQHDKLCVFLILVVLCYVLIHISTDASPLATASGTFQPRFATGTTQSVTSHLIVTSHYFQQRFRSNIRVTLHGHQFTPYCFPAKYMWMQMWTKL